MAVLVWKLETRGVLWQGFRQNDTLGFTPVTAQRRRLVPSTFPLLLHPEERGARRLSRQRRSRQLWHQIAQERMTLWGKKWRIVGGILIFLSSVLHPPFLLSPFPRGRFSGILDLFKASKRKETPHPAPLRLLQSWVTKLQVCWPLEQVSRDHCCGSMWYCDRTLPCLKIENPLHQVW